MSKILFKYFKSFVETINVLTACCSECLLATTAALVNALGGRAEELPEELIVHGQSALSGGTVDGANDHRIVMAAAIAATVCKGSVTIRGAEAVNKSYPHFWAEYRRLGGKYE